MELREFISSTLVQITEGIKEAQSIATEMGSIINPAQITGKNLVTAIIEDKKRLVQIVDFQIGLTSTNNKNNKKGIGVNLGGIKGGANSDTVNTSSSATSISFSIPVALPESDNNNTKYETSISIGQKEPNPYRY